MSSVTANDLKTKGVSAIEQVLKKDREAIITVRGARKYVVLDFATYNRLREYELDNAIREARDDVANGRYKTESVGEHIKRVSS
jgi:PHD/YefM family antitoxin component YafN of YafNO toxin-antitoxin module